MSESFDVHVRSGLDLGADHWCHREFLLASGDLIGYPRDAEIPEGAVLIGIHEHHRSLDPNPDKAGQWCGGYLHFKNVPEALIADERFGTVSLHELVAADPLTIAPSVGCRRCPAHGYIQEGTWRDC